eukprot:929991_1
MNSPIGKVELEQGSNTDPNIHHGRDHGHAKETTSLTNDFSGLVLGKRSRADRATQAESSNGSFRRKTSKKSKNLNDELLDKILKQLEFYFSDSNLPRDKFLLSLTEEDDGWVSLSAISTFNRMRRLTTDLTAITLAARLSPSLLEVSADGARVRRRTPLPTDEDLEGMEKRTLNFSGAPKDSSIDSMIECFSQHGTVLSVRIFKRNQGCGLVEFSSVEEATRVIENPPKLLFTIKMRTRAAWEANVNRARSRKTNEKSDKMPEIEGERSLNDDNVVMEGEETISEIAVEEKNDSTTDENVEPTGPQTYHAIHLPVEIHDTQKKRGCFVCSFVKRRQFLCFGCPKLCKNNQKKKVWPAFCIVPGRNCFTKYHMNLAKHKSKREKRVSEIQETNL